MLSISVGEIISSIIKIKDINRIRTHDLIKIVYPLRDELEKIYLKTRIKIDVTGTSILEFVRETEGFELKQDPDYIVIFSGNKEDLPEVSQ